MRDALTRRQSLALVGGTFVGLNVAGYELGDQLTRKDTATGALRRFATTVEGAEFTGLFVTDDGTLFCNVHGPAATNDKPYDRAAIGVFEGVDVRSIPVEFDGLSPSWTRQGRKRFRSRFGSHRVLANGGDPTDDGEQLGVTTEPDGEPLTDASKPDFNAFVPFEASTDGATAGYLYTSWEHTTGAVSRLHLRRDGDASTGRWTVLRSENLDMRPISGIWRPCFGTVSPWGTPLFSEEYEPDARKWYQGESYQEAGEPPDHELVEQYLGYFGNPYRYGWVVEAVDPLASSPRFEKRFALGRFSHENALVLPDRRTVYLTDDVDGDDGLWGVFFKFVADRPGDLTAGTLFAAKLTQDAGSDPGTVGFDVTWLELGHATESEVASWVREYDGQEVGGASITDEEIAEWAAGDGADDRAAFLESRRAAIAVGATGEWSKMEGVNAKPDAVPGDGLYLAVSRIEGQMLDGGSTSGGNDIRLDGLRQGVLYRATLGATYDIARIEPAVVGSRNGLWGPDNVVVLDDGRVLVGEDGAHVPNQLWLFDPGATDSARK
ncbi:alkaline phosphatase PhoX [Haloarchaeobius sp. DFWS5]|uniref:alkaline phosphatase PhoX n=1 Tax=Haloarchaeobius sp. DFWS5 TaxID=3446114 RepID=UPI003EBA14C7